MERHGGNQHGNSQDSGHRKPQFEIFDTGIDLRSGRCLIDHLRGAVAELFDLAHDLRRIDQPGVDGDECSLGIEIGVDPQNALVSLEHAFDGEKAARAMNAADCQFDFLGALDGMVRPGAPPSARRRTRV